MTMNGYPNEALLVGYVSHVRAVAKALTEGAQVTAEWMLNVESCWPWYEEALGDHLLYLLRRDFEGYLSPHRAQGESLVDLLNRVGEKLAGMAVDLDELVVASVSLHDYVNTSDDKLRIYGMLASAELYAGVEVELSKLHRSKITYSLQVMQALYRYVEARRTLQMPTGDERFDKILAEVPAARTAGVNWFINGYPFDLLAADARAVRNGNHEGRTLAIGRAYCTTLWAHPREMNLSPDNYEIFDFKKVELPRLAIRHSIALDAEYSANLIDAAALFYTLGRLVDSAYLSGNEDWHPNKEVPYDRALAGALRLALGAAAIINKRLAEYEDGVFTYDHCELPARDSLMVARELPTLYPRTLPCVLWNRMDGLDWYNLSENFQLPEWLHDVMEDWLRWLERTDMAVLHPKG